MKTKFLKLMIRSSLTLLFGLLLFISFTSCQNRAKGKELVDKLEVAIRSSEWGGDWDSKIVPAAREIADNFGIENLSKADRERYWQLDEEAEKFSRRMHEEGCSMEIFKKHFKGIKLECSNNSYSQRFEESNGKIIVYLKLHGRGEWSKECICPYVIYKYSDGIMVRLEYNDNDDTPYGALWFSIGGYPQKFVTLGMNRGELRIVDF